MADRLGISRSALSDKLNGKRPLRESEIIALCRLIGIPHLDWLGAEIMRPEDARLHELLQRILDARDRSALMTVTAVLQSLVESPPDSAATGHLPESQSRDAHHRPRRRAASGSS